MNERNRTIEREVGLELDSRTEGEALDAIKAETKKQLKNISDFHGWEHTELVADYAKLIAVGDGKNVFNAEVAGLTHDWGRAVEGQDTAKRKHAELSGVVSKDFYRELYENKKITAKQYGETQRAVRRHSLNTETTRETLKIVRDADRLSRFGALGLYHNIKGLAEEWQLPFYIDGQEVLRPENSPVMKRSELKCVVDHLNFVFEWIKIMETETGKKIIKIFEPNYRALLKLISQHRDIKETKTWLDFLEPYALDFKKKKEEFEDSFQWTGTATDSEAWLKFYAEVDNQQVFTEENFEKFIQKH